MFLFQYTCEDYPGINYLPSASQNWPFDTPFDSPRRQQPLSFNPFPWGGQTYPRSQYAEPYDPFAYREFYPPYYLQPATIPVIISDLRQRYYPNQDPYEAYRRASLPIPYQHGLTDEDIYSNPNLILNMLTQPSNDNYLPYPGSLPNKRITSEPSTTTTTPELPTKSVDIGSQTEKVSSRFEVTDTPTSTEMVTTTIEPKTLEGVVEVTTKANEPETTTLVPLQRMGEGDGEESGQVTSQLENGCTSEARLENMIYKIIARFMAKKDFSDLAQN